MFDLTSLFDWQCDHDGDDGDDLTFLFDWECDYDGDDLTFLFDWECDDGDGDKSQWWWWQWHFCWCDDDDHGSMRSVSFIILIRIGMLISCCFFSRLCVDLPRVFWQNNWVAREKSR